MPNKAHEPAPSVDPRARTRRQLDRLVEQAEQTIAAAGAPRAPTTPAETFEPFVLADLAAPAAAGNAAQFAARAEVELRIEFGRTRVALDEALAVGDGSLIMLDQRCGEPVDIYADSKLVARGEVLLMNDCYCVRIIELVADAARAAA